MKQFFHDLMTEGNPRSSRRFVTLIISFLFICTAASIPFLLLALFIYVDKLQGLNIEALKAIIDLVKTVFQYEFWIIAAGLFVTTVQGRIDLFKSLFSRKEEVTETPIPPYDPITPVVPEGSR
jgi:hypothetical protein